MWVGRQICARPIASTRESAFCLAGAAAARYGAAGIVAALNGPHPCSSEVSTMVETAMRIMTISGASDAPVPPHSRSGATRC